MQCARALLQSANRGNTALQLGVSQIVPELVQFLASAATVAETVQADDPLIATTDEVIKILVSFVATFDDDSSESPILFTPASCAVTELSNTRTSSLYGSRPESDRAIDPGSSEPDTQPGGPPSLSACGTSTYSFQGRCQHARARAARPPRDFYSTECCEHPRHECKGTGGGQASNLPQVVRLDCQYRARMICCILTILTIYDYPLFNDIAIVWTSANHHPNLSGRSWAPPSMRYVLGPADVDRVDCLRSTSTSSLPYCQGVQPVERYCGEKRWLRADQDESSTLVHTNRTEIPRARFGTYSFSSLFPLLDHQPAIVLRRRRIKTYQLDRARVERSRLQRVP